MARGYYRTDDRICLHCGFSETDENGTKRKMPYKYGKGANIAFLCRKCAEKEKNSNLNIVSNL